MTEDELEGYETVYDYLLETNKQYVTLLREAVPHQRMIDEHLLGDDISSDDLRQAAKEHEFRMAALRKAGVHCQVCEGKPCNITQIAEDLTSQLSFHSDESDSDYYDTGTKSGYLQQRASNRHNRSNYDEIVQELPSCCLGADGVEGCDAHFYAYWSIKTAATF